MQVSNRFELNSLKMAKIWRKDSSAAVHCLYNQGRGEGGGGGGGGGVSQIVTSPYSLPAKP